MKFSTPQSWKSRSASASQNPKLEYIIWNYNDVKLDNVFLFGSVKDDFLNLLIDTNEWNEKVKFLENRYELNK
jgi:hypothetical protein